MKICKDIERKIETYNEHFVSQYLKSRRKDHMFVDKKVVILFVGDTTYFAKSIGFNTYAIRAITDLFP